MLMAAMGDIHGNIIALENALQIIDELGIQTIVNTGDLVVGYPFGNQVIQLVQRYRMPTVQGIFDRYTALFRKKEARIVEKLTEQEHRQLEETYAKLSLTDIEFLRTLPRRIIFTLEGLSICVCHGTPMSAVDTLEEHDSESRFMRVREYANVHIIISGKTHRPFARHVADTLFVNPGSLGIPVDSEPVGTFALINTETRPWQVTFEKVRFKPELIEKRLREISSHT